MVYVSLVRAYGNTCTIHNPSCSDIRTRAVIKGFYHYCYHYIMAAQELINPFPLSNISPGEFQKAKTLRRSQSNPLSKGFTGHGGHDMISVEGSVERSRDMSKKAPTSLKSIKTIQSSMTSTRASSSSMRRPQSAGPTAGK